MDDSSLEINPDGISCRKADNQNCNRQNRTCKRIFGRDNCDYPAADHRIDIGNDKITAGYRQGCSSIWNPLRFKKAEKAFQAFQIIFHSESSC